MAIPQPEWSVSSTPGEPGTSIDLSGWHASFGQGGCVRAGGQVTAEVARSVHQGMELKASIGGIVKWSGPISKEPLVYRGQASLEASGWQQKAVKSTGRLLYQSRDPSLFVPASGAPYNATVNQELSMTGKENEILCELSEGLGINNTEQNHMNCAAPGTPGGITRLQYSWRSHNATTALNLRTLRGTWPSDPTTVEATHGINATSGTVDEAIGTESDVIGIQFQAITTTAVNAYWLQLYNLRFDGIGSDTFTTSQVVSDILGRLGFDTSGVQPSGVNAMPYDSSGNWLEAMLYMAFLDDWTLNIVPDDQGNRVGIYRPWGDKTWDISLESAEPTLNSLELNNAVCVTYPHVGGFDAEKTITAADIGETDPLAGTDADNCLNITLRDPQPDDALADATGQALLRRLIQPRYEGTITLPEVRDATVWDIRFGDELNVEDWGPLEARRLPVESVSLSESEPAQIGIYSPGAELALQHIVGLQRARAAQNPALPAIDVVAGEFQKFQAGQAALKEWKKRHRQWHQNHKYTKGGKAAWDVVHDAWHAANPKPGFGTTAPSWGGHEGSSSW